MRNSQQQRATNGLLTDTFVHPTTSPVVKALEEEAENFAQAAKGWRGRRLSGSRYWNRTGPERARSQGQIVSNRAAWRAVQDTVMSNPVSVWVSSCTRSSRNSQARARP